MEVDFEKIGEVQEFDLRLNLKDKLVTGFKDCLERNECDGWRYFSCLVWYGLFRMNGSPNSV